MYEPIHQMGMWVDNFKPSCSPSIAPASLVVEAQTNLDNQVCLLMYLSVSISICYSILLELEHFPYKKAELLCRDLVSPVGGCISRNDGNS